MTKRIRKRCFSELYDVVSLSSVAQREDVKSFFIEKERSILIDSTRYIRMQEHSKKDLHKFAYAQPNLEVIQVNNCIAIGGTNILIYKNQVIIPDLANLSKDILLVELNGYAQYNQETNKLALFSPYWKSKTINHAINLLGQCFANYAHFLTETLPKLALIDRIGGYDHVPLLIDAGLPKKFFDAISLCDKHHRKIILVERWQKISIKLCIEVSPPAYTPIRRKCNNFLELPPPEASRHTFSQTAFRLLTETLASAPTQRNTKKQPTWAGRSKLCVIRDRNSSFNKRNAINFFYS